MADSSPSSPKQKKHQAKQSSPSPNASAKKQGKPLFLFVCGLLTLPFLLALWIALASLSPSGRERIARLGHAFQVFRAETPSLHLSPNHDSSSPQARANPRNPRSDQENSPLTANASNTNQAPPAPTARPLGPIPTLPNRVPSNLEWNPKRQFNGVNIQTEVKQTQGGLAQNVRKQSNAYQARWQVEVTVPKPAKTLDELEVAAPDLGTLLPELKRYLPKAQVSRIWAEMYRRKLHELGSNLTNLGRAPYRHNLFDLNTALQFEGENNTPVFLMQADMDIVSDGSDGDRLPEMPEDIIYSPHYQPTTSYGWPKQTKRPNPLIQRFEKGNQEAETLLKQARAELAQNPSNARRNELKKTIEAQEKRSRINQRIINDLSARSYLIAEHDPFIVMPTWTINWQGQDDKYIPEKGDYAVVFHKGKALPAIVGDAGPDSKVGEASLRLAREIDPGVSPYRGAVNDLSITYLIFPGSRDWPPRNAPDYDHWHKRCSELLEQIGGLGQEVKLHHWKNTLPTLPTLP